MKLTFINEDSFKQELQQTDSQRRVMEELFRDEKFIKLWNYLKNCPIKITLLVTPDFEIDGVERFGGWADELNTLFINPTKQEHQDNPQELVDTLVHELIHAVMTLKEDCGKCGYPFDDDVKRI